MEQLNNQNPSQEEALVLVNSMPFPEAVIGDRVRQYGYWFELTETNWVVSTDPAQGGNQ
jgi:hypothetical protein